MISFSRANFASPKCKMQFMGPLRHLAAARPLGARFVGSRSALTKASVEKGSIATTELIKQVSAAVDIHEQEVKQVINTTFKLIEEKITAGEKVQITGFGTFKRADRRARTGRNPQTGEAIDIPAKGKAAFSPSKALNDCIAANYTPPTQEAVEQTAAP